MKPEPKASSALGGGMTVEEEAPETSPVRVGDKAPGAEAPPSWSSELPFIGSVLATLTTEGRSLAARSAMSGGIGGEA